MSEQRAFLVCGPESSGNRLMTRLLVAAGCYGDGDHFQRLDRSIPEGASLLAWLRSVPHAHQWPDLSQMIYRLQLTGYDVHAVVMSRDWTAVSRSQVHHGHVPDIETALTNIRRAWRHIFEHLNQTAVPFTVVNYESLVQRPYQATFRLLGMLGLPMPNSEYIYDGNVKWFRED